jgi:DNA invertase Pin-like site-specific DNA recombinase
VVARLAAGRKAKAAGGGYAGGRPRLGFRGQEGELVVDDLAAKVVQGIFLHIARDRWTVRRVAEELDGRRALGRRWDHAKVARIVRCEDYKRGQRPIVDPRIWNKANAVLDSRRYSGERAAA